jgi:hypothetical protein
MTHTPIHLLRAAALVLAVVMTFASAMPAAAGCLLEYDSCGDCARKHLRDAILGLDVDGLEDAYLEGIDCDIDFVHCLLFGMHHDYGCGI